MPLIIERCIGCAEPVMVSIEGVFVPLHGRPIRCTLCLSCAQMLEAGDPRLSALIELRLLLTAAVE